MLPAHHFAVPDRAFFGLTALVVLLTAGFSIWALPQLPSTVPAHFGLSGQPNSYTDAKTLIVLLPVLIQLLLVALVSWAYRHPAYFNFPTRRHVRSLTKPAQTALYTLARHMLAVVLVIAVLVLAHLAEGVVLVGLGLSGAPDPGIMMFLVGFLLLALGVYIAWMRRIIRRGTTDPTPLQG